MLNYYFQAFATSVFVKVNAKWFHYRERGLFGGLFNVITSSGYFLSLTVGGLVVSRLPVEWVFYMPAMLLLAMVLFNFFFVKATPADAGFLKEDEENNEAAYKDNSDQETKAEVGDFLLCSVVLCQVKLIEPSLIGLLPATSSMDGYHSKGVACACGVWRDGHGEGWCVGVVFCLRGDLRGHSGFVVLSDSLYGYLLRWGGGICAVWLDVG